MNIIRFVFIIVKDLFTPLNISNSTKPSNIKGWTQSIPYSLSCFC